MAGTSSYIYPHRIFRPLSVLENSHCGLASVAIISYPLCLIGIITNMPSPKPLCISLMSSYLPITLCHSIVWHNEAFVCRGVDSCCLVVYMYRSALEDLVDSLSP